ncbi:hypothetical protein EVAR_102904_1 [Eumeta japonica]|uniref:Uncharacterized protein n=1 Tax=Eumeta variegata TaxID=151549 RepID=A0A4C1ZJ61_EUMVA|nr:hypothetical protein EVAR_102904_1 [Eumeta japonica]
MGRDTPARRIKFVKLTGRVLSNLAAVCFNFTSVCDALLELHDETNDSVAASEALSQMHYVNLFDSTVTLVARYDILFKANIVSKAMQAEFMDVSNASQLLQNCFAFVK